VVRSDGNVEADDPRSADSLREDAADGQANSEFDAPATASQIASDRDDTEVPAGPTDRQFRIGAAVVIPVALLGMLLAFFAMQGMTMGAVIVVGLGPFAIFYGIAALFDPNIARAAGKFGTHLPRRYKQIAFFVGVVALACSLGLSFLLLWR
jgi:hypothetical protein